MEEKVKLLRKLDSEILGYMYLDDEAAPIEEVEQADDVMGEIYRTII